ncbi:hypothetical protein FRB99_007181 [Tulasnella sp. 403]|nr:hypothetical protein FRB99_007181 [Tulasnella sp. 403]
MANTPDVSRSDVEIANIGADNFLRLFYNAHDSSSQSRRDNVPKFYRATSTVNWNGTTIIGADALAGFLARMPLTKHEVQSYDCHAIPGSASEGRPASLLITVSGLVTHGPSAKADTITTSTKVLDAAPRVFSQSFVLVPDETSTSGKEPKYYVASDSLRFAGLFSAINTAFILESYKGLRPDSSATTNQLLLMLLVHRNDDTPFTEDIMASFSSPDISSVSVNCFYFTSLACSLVAAFGAVNTKQWLLEYASIGSSLSQEALGRRRQAKYDEMNRWHVDVVITALPLILQSSLLLFFIGTTKFLWQINHTVAIIFLVVFLMGFWIYLMSMAVGIASPASPFQTPELELVQTLILKPVITLLGLFRLSSSQPVSVSDPVMDQHSPAAEEHSVIDMMDEDSTATSEDKTTLNCALWMFEQAESRDVALCAASMFCRIRADLLFDRLSHPTNRTTLERIIAFHQSTFAIEGTGKPCDAPSWLPSSIVSGLALNHVLSGRRWDRDSLDEILEDYHMWHIYPSNTPLGVISTALAMRLSSTPFWYMSNSLSQLLEAATTSLPLRIAPPVASNPSAPVTSINISPFKTVLHLVIHYAMQAEVDADFMAHTPAFKEISETLHNRATDWMSDDAELTSLVALTIATLNWFGRDKSATPWSYPSDTEQRRFESILWDRYLALDKR